MRLLIPVLAIHAAILITALPTTEVTLSSLNFPSDELTSLLSSRDPNTPADCPRAEKTCGVVTFSSGQYAAFGQGTCMPLGKNVQSVYVAKCYCSLWYSCKGGHGDIYVGGMMMCEKPRLVDKFERTPRFVSCGGMN